MFRYTDGRLWCDEVDLEAIAREAGTPCYVYSARAILDAYRDYDAAFGSLPHMVCYAVKANSTLAILSLLARAGSGFDIVSGGELHRVLAAGGDPERVVFSGVGKTAAEIEFALRKGVGNFNCESERELALIDEVACRLGLIAHFSLRVNPDVDAVTHPYISTGLRDHKFGIDIDAAEAVYHRARRHRNLRAAGVSCHIGSQILDYAPILEAAGKVLALVERLQAAGLPIDHVDLPEAGSESLIRRRTVRRHPVFHPGTPVPASLRMASASWWNRAVYCGQCGRTAHTGHVPQKEPVQRIRHRRCGHE